MEERKLRESEFHDGRERDRYLLETESFQKKYANLKIYSVARKSRAFVSDWIRQHAGGKVALDYCCGRGELSLELAEHGALVYGIDISGESIRSAQRRIAESGYAARCKFNVMDAEALQFENGFFDLIICSGVLHHLNCARAYQELARVLKQDGKVLCIEALGYNPAIQWYRRKTPHLRTAWEVDHILTLRELESAGRYFDRVDIRFFHLFSILAVPFRKTFLFEPMLAFLEAVDAVLLRLPLVKLLAWQMVFVLSGPRGQPQRRG